MTRQSVHRPTSFDNDRPRSYTDVMNWSFGLRLRTVGLVIVALLVVTIGLRPYAPWGQAFAIAGGLLLNFAVGYIWTLIIWPEPIDGWTRGVWAVGLAIAFLTILTFGLSWLGLPIKPVTLVGQNLVVAAIGAWLVHRRSRRQTAKT